MSTLEANISFDFPTLNDKEEMKFYKDISGLGLHFAHDIQPGAHIPEILLEVSKCGKNGYYIKARDSASVSIEGICGLSTRGYSCRVCTNKDATVLNVDSMDRSGSDFYFELAYDNEL